LRRYSAAGRAKAILVNPLASFDSNDPYPAYGDSQLMTENTEQYDSLVKIKENLEIIFIESETQFEY